jgi:hypothetical protein
VATLKAYVTQLHARQKVIARKLGADIAYVDKTSRVLNLSLLTLLAVVVKTLVDKGVIADAELLATLDTARDDAYDNQPIQPDPEP